MVVRLDGDQYAIYFLQRSGSNQIARQPLRKCVVVIAQITGIDALAEAEAGQESRQIAACQLPPLKHGKSEDHLEGMARQPGNAVLEGGEPPVGTRKSVFDFNEWRAMTGDDDVNRQTGQPVEGLPCCLETSGVVRMAEQLGEYDTEAIAPKRVAGDQDAPFGVVKGQCIHVVTGNRDGVPVEAAEFDLVTVGHRRVVAEARSRLAKRRQEQRLFIPFGNRRVDADGNDDLAGEGLHHGGVAPDMVGMRVRVEQAHQAAASECVLHQSNGLRGLRDVAAINQRGLLAFKKNDVVRREPATFENQQAFRKHQEAAGKFSSIAIVAKFVAAWVVLGSTPFYGGEDRQPLIQRGAAPACDFFKRAKTATAKPADLIHLADIDAR